MVRQHRWREIGQACLNHSMNTETTAFSGWTYDYQVEAAYAPLTIAKTAKGMFWTCFWLLSAAGMLRAVTDMALPRWFLIACGGGLLVGIVLCFVAQARARQPPLCAQCGKGMRLEETVLTARECRDRGYASGVSGHAYRIGTGEDASTAEVRKQWFCCHACKRYFLFDGQAEDRIRSVAEREADYASSAEIRRQFVGKRIIMKPSPLFRGTRPH